MYIQNNFILDSLILSLKESITNKRSESYDVINALMDNTKSIYGLDEELSKLRSIILHWDIVNEGDILGFIYQEIENTANKKNKGQYFTPPEIVSTLVDAITEPLFTIELEPLKEKRILDPACGSGQFIIALLEKLKTIYLSFGITKKEAYVYALDNIYGYDIDETALKITAFNLKKITGIDFNFHLAKHDFIYKDNLQFNQNKLDENTFDIVIGNPPWGSSLTNEEKKYYRNNYYSGKSGINTFTLFIERSLEVLEGEGSLAFLIPEAFLNIKAHKNCRELILHNSYISNITVWGDQFKKVYAPAVSIILSKNSSFKKENSITITNKSKNRSYSNLFIKQHHLLNTPENIINITFSERALNIITHIQDQDCFYLSKNAKFFLGIVTGNNEDFLHNTLSEQAPDKIIRGKELSKFQIHEAKKFFKYDPVLLQQTAPQGLYKSRDKIIYKFIGKKLTFALDREGNYTLNNVNGFIPEMDTVSAEAMVAVLNSSLIQYFYEKNFFTLKVLRGNLERLPLKNLSKSASELLARYAREAEASSSHYSLQEYQNKIDDIVFHEYDIKDKEAFHIWEEYNTTKWQQSLPLM